MTKLMYCKEFVMNEYIFNAFIWNYFSPNLVLFQIDIMSRVIIKNLPQKIKDEKLRDLFQQIGHVTDIRVIRTKDGFSRHFGYIGFMESECSQKAVDQFNDTYLDGMKIQVEIAKSFNDPNLPRPWSRFSKGSSAYVKRETKKTLKKKPETKSLSKSRSENTTESDNKDKNPNLDEFLSMFDKRSKIQTQSIPDIDSILTPSKTITDLDYLQTKVSKNIPNDNTNDAILFTIKIIGLPFKSTNEDIKQFFLPILLSDDAIRIIRNKKNRPTGRAYVDFKSRKEMYKALRRNGDYMQDRYIELFQDTLNNESAATSNRDQKEETDQLLEHGRLFIRNLSYTVSQTDLENLFSPFGALSEVYLPVDPTTHNSIGFGFVTFMFSEHACHAISELDASIFMGRILHILPAEPKPDKVAVETDSKPASYRDKKKKELKSQASNSYNWNTLFLGSNAVAEAISKKYNTTKSKLLDSEAGTSIAVRMALAETEIVSETKEFLKNSGIDVEALTNTNSKIKRSKTVILVKNLAFGTTADEIDILFSPFGTLGRVLMPKYGITGVVEFLSESHAKNAFGKLAYSKFKHLPLYLEWAPCQIFINEIGEKNVENEQITKGPAQYTIYVKNLNFTTQETELEEVFKKYKPIQTSITKKRNPNNVKEMQSMGFGFVKFADFKSAKNAILEKQGCTVDDHKLEISLAKLTMESKMPLPKKPTVTTPNKDSANVLLIKNIPFEASKTEVYAIFSRFGALKSLRLPKKVISHDNSKHRGFCFVEFFSQDDALLAFDALKSSTHLYGRRLVLEYATNDQDIERLRNKTKQQFVDESTSSVSKKSKIEFDL